MGGKRTEESDREDEGLRRAGSMQGYDKGEKVIKRLNRKREDKGLAVR